MYGANCFEGMGAMTRYFFDVVGRSQSTYDFHGELFSHPQEAYNRGQLLALDLEVSSEEEQELVGDRVGIRGVDGREVFSIPIGEADVSCV